MYGGLLIDPAVHGKARRFALAQPHEGARYGAVIGPDIGFRTSWASKTSTGWRGSDLIFGGRRSPHGSRRQRSGQQEASADLEQSPARHAAMKFGIHIRSFRSSWMMERAARTRPLARSGRLDRDRREISRCRGFVADRDRAATSCRAGACRAAEGKRPSRKKAAEDPSAAPQERGPRRRCRRPSPSYRCGQASQGNPGSRLPATYPSRTSSPSWRSCCLPEQSTGSSPRRQIPRGGKRPTVQPTSVS
ncbi:hypothetical protein AB395_00003024 [Sinorhizobium fredii CCBAU 45436]|nr:hypothetical protein AB395_00003024 [Sinorhizobium fredii CCBAU 45436]